MKIDIYRDVKKEFRWRALARNGKILACSGEGYKRRSALVRTLKNLRKNFSNAVVIGL